MTKAWTHVALAALALACSRPEKAPAVEKPVAPVVDEPAKEALALERVADDTFGYAIRLPAGVKQLQNSQLAQTFSYVFPGGLYEVNVNLTPAGHADLESLVGLATMVGQKEITRKEELEGGGFLVVKEPQGPLREVWAFRKGVLHEITARCTGPAKQTELLLEICTSLEAL